MSSGETDKRELLARLQAGDEESLVRLIEDYAPEIRRAARLRLGPLLRPHLDSVDLVQSVCMALIEGFRHDQFQLTGPEKLVALASGIIRRKVARTWRQCRRRSAAEAQAAFHPNGHDRPITAGHGALDPAAEVEQADTLEEVLSRLEPRDRALLELRLAGCTTAEASRRLGVDADVLRVRLSRLRKRLTNQNGCGTLPIDPSSIA